MIYWDHQSKTLLQYGASIESAQRIDHLYVLERWRNSPKSHHAMLAATTKRSSAAEIDIWHERLGNPRCSSHSSYAAHAVVKPTNCNLGEQNHTGGRRAG